MCLPRHRSRLQEARRRSGNLGGRPRKPTQAEARDAALEQLVPKALKSLAEHLGDGDPAAWRAALRVLEYAWGKPKEELAVEVEMPENPLDVARMPREQRLALIARLARQQPEVVREIMGPAWIVERPSDAESADVGLTERLSPPAALPRGPRAVHEPEGAVAEASRIAQDLVVARAWNIFSISREPRNEDQFTEMLAWLANAVPAVRRALLEMAFPKSLDEPK